MNPSSHISKLALTFPFSLQTFSAPPPLPTSIIPRSLLLSKRLAQCLNPALPSGVHHRALSVYRQIFLQLSTDGLRRDLAIWSPGLLPFFERANTSTRPVVLALLEDFYLPLADELKPMTRAFLLAVLPGLEEEGAENFDRTLKLLDGLKRSVADELFWRCLWAAIITNPGVRQASINFLVKRPPPANTATSPADINLIPRAFSALLTSSDLLIVRGGLDLLLEHLPLHSSRWNSIPWPEKVRLTRSATGVVLRRELSLNRRLWTWLGGSPSDHAKLASSKKDYDGDEEKQEVRYLQTYGLDVLNESLLSDMLAAPPIAADHDDDQDSESANLMATRQRPFRIYLALLDKWSVGSTLTSVLALDCIRAIQLQVRSAIPRKPSKASTHRSEVEAKDFLLTASMLFDAIDKDIFCKQVLSAIAQELGTQKDTQQQQQQQQKRASDHTSKLTLPPTELLAFTLDHFTFKDDVSRNIHLPNLFAAIASMLQKAIVSDSSAQSCQRAIHNCQTLLPLVPKPVFQVPQVAQALTSPTGQNDQGNFEGLVLAFYHASPLQRLPIDFQQSVILDSLLDTCTAASLAAIAKRHGAMTTSLLNLCALLLDTISKSRTANTAQQHLQFDSRQWSSHLATRLENASAFSECDAIITALVAGAKCSALSQPINLKETAVAGNIYHRLIDFLQPSTSPYHARAVDLFWQADAQLAPSGYLQTFLCQGILASDDIDCSPFRRAIEAFGAIWRHSSDEALLTDAIAAPLARILDLLRSSDLSRRQCGETWLRANVRSYTPIFHSFLKSFQATGLQSADRRPFETAYSDSITVRGYAYSRPFDHQLVNYLLATLLAIARYGAAGFVRGARSDATITLASSSASAKAPRTFLDEFIDLFFGLLRTDANILANCAPTELFQRTNAVTHALSADLLQALVSRGALSPPRLQDAETILLERLLVSIQARTVARQHKLLLTLHSVITTRAAQQGTVKMSDSQRRRQQGSPEQHAPPVHPLLLPAIAGGVLRSSNRSALAHWVDFILLTVPQYRRALNSFLVPLNDCLCRAVLGFQTSLKSIASGDLPQTGASAANEADLVLVLSALERVMSLCIDESHAVSIGQHEEEDNALQIAGSAIAPPPPAAQASRYEGSTTPATHSSHGKDASAPESSSGLFGYVTGMFGGDTAGDGDAASGPAARPRANATLTALQLAISTLHGLWTTLSLDAHASILASSHEAFASKIKTRCRRILERLYKGSSSSTAEILIDCWSRSGVSADTETSRESVFEILAILTPGAQTLVTYLCDTLSTRLPSPGSAKPTWTPDQIVSDPTLLSFLEVFLERMAIADAGGVWPVVMMLIKDLLANSAAHKAYLFPALRILTVLGEKLIQSSGASDDKKIKRDLQETYSKLFDLCVLIAGRSFDSTTWIRRSARETAATPTTAESVASLEEKGGMSASVPDLAGPASVETIIDYLAHHGLAALRRFALDQDKVAATCSNAVYYIVAPPLRAKGNEWNVPDGVLLLASEISKVPGALKALKSPLSDAFWDPRFFRLSPSAAQKWRTPILALYRSDKERFLEMLGRVSAAPTANININIFANRHAEILLRAQNLRRLSFVIYAAGQNQFLPLLPAIQEKLVDVLRTNASSHTGADIVNAEVYLCLRAMLCRFDTQHLVTLWPIVITEMMRLFDTAIEEIATVNADTAQLLLSACKFLDLLVTLQADDFQMQQWLFINDTGLTADESIEESILDRFALAIEEQQRRHVTTKQRRANAHAKTSSIDSAATSDSVTAIQRANLRRPLLVGMTTCSNVEQLLPFLHQVNSAAFGFGEDAGAGTFAVDKVDTGAIEADLRADMFRRSGAS